MLAFVLSRLYCCNAVLAGLQSSSLTLLQHVLHTVVHLVTGQVLVIIYRKMMEIHWLAIKHRIKLKLCVIMHVAVSGE